MYTQRLPGLLIRHRVSPTTFFGHRQDTDVTPVSREADQARTQDADLPQPRPTPPLPDSQVFSTCQDALTGSPCGLDFARVEHTQMLVSTREGLQAQVSSKQTERRNSMGGQVRATGYNLSPCLPPLTPLEKS